MALQRVKQSDANHARSQGIAFSTENLDECRKRFSPRLHPLRARNNLPSIFVCDSQKNFGKEKEKHSERKLRQVFILIGTILIDDWPEAKGEFRCRHRMNACGIKQRQTRILLVNEKTDLRAT